MPTNEFKQAHYYPAQMAVTMMMMNAWDYMLGVAAANVGI